MVKLEKATNTNLKKLTEMIQNRELLLPDFQRGFVWGVEKQRSLIASVLAKMPIGSVLLLEAKISDYGCRVPGRKDEPDLSDRNSDGTVYALLDGQQRLTALTNVFSNLLYYDYAGSGRLCCDYKKLISTDLRNRFFLKIPAIENLNCRNDLFHLKRLSFFPGNPESDVPDFLTGDIIEYIEKYSFDEKTEEPYAPHTAKPQRITKFCMQDDAYLIPLYLLIGSGNDSSETRLKTVLKNIVEDVVHFRMEQEFDVLPSPGGQRAFVETHIEPDYLEEIIVDGNVSRERLQEKWIEMGETHWADRMRQYLMSCITDMDLHQIIVDDSNRNRAIDIYENLNMGGIALSTFELILARAAKSRTAGNKNLSDAIVGYIQTPGEYDLNLLPENIDAYFRAFYKANPCYSAAEYLGCLDEKRNQLNVKYTEAFLNILSLASHFPEYDVSRNDIVCIKREKILQLDAEQIWANYKGVCRGIDRACFFLQTRCGVRKITEVNYNLMLVLLGYLFFDDAFYHDKGVSQLLEAWYWIAVFSGRYDKDQNENMMEDLERILKSIRTGADREWLYEMKAKVFAMPGFSDEKTLLLATSVIPKSVMRKSICQFYLAKTYRDLCTETVLHTFCDQACALEEHHIVPVGSLAQTYKDMERAEKKKERSDKSSIFNSPLNFALITKQSNLTISGQRLDFYIQFCNQTGVYGLNIETSGPALGEEDIGEVLRKRFLATRSAVEERIIKFL